MSLKAEHIIHLLLETEDVVADYRRHPCKGVYADYSHYPDGVYFYVKCPKCGLLHGNYKNLIDAVQNKICPVCKLEIADKLRKEVYNVIHVPQYKPKRMTKLVGLE